MNSPRDKHVRCKSRPVALALNRCYGRQVLTVAASSNGNRFVLFSAEDETGIKGSAGTICRQAAAIGVVGLGVI